MAALGSGSSPSQAADVFAFGRTTSSQLFPSDPTKPNYATLELDDNGTWVFLTSLGIQGWVSPTVNATNPSTNTSYVAGTYLGNSFADYFSFNLAGTVCEVGNSSDCFSLPTNANITAAQLVIYSGKISNNLQYSLFGATSLLSQLTGGSKTNATLYSNLLSLSSSLSNSYGQFSISKNTSSPTTLLTFVLNSNAVEELNTVNGQTNRRFVVAGTVGAPVPEPSTWVMIVAGFAGLGVIAQRRSARRRTTRAAG